MSTQLKTLDIALPINGLEAYLARVKQIPVLTAQEERQLAERHCQAHDLAAAQKLVLSNLRFVVHIAQGYLGYGLPLPDLIQEGNVGLMKAVKRFDPAVGVRLISFAVHWIKAEIQEFILRNLHIVKFATTKEKRKLFFNLRKLKRRLGWLSQGEVNTIAKDLNVKAKTVRDMEYRLATQDTSVDISDVPDDQKNAMARAALNHFEDHRYDPARLLESSDFSEYNQDHLYKNLKLLDERSRNIIMRRWLSKPHATLHTLAKHYKISPERIRQLEQNAMRRLRVAIEEAA